MPFFWLRVLLRVCLIVYVSMRFCVYISVCICECNMSVGLFVCEFVCLCVNGYDCVGMCSTTYIYQSVYMCVSVCMCFCVCV